MAQYRPRVFDRTLRELSIDNHTQNIMNQCCCGGGVVCSSAAQESWCSGFRGCQEAGRAAWVDQLIRLFFYWEVAGTEEIAMQRDAGQPKSCTNSRIKLKTENM